MVTTLPSDAVKAVRLVGDATVWVTSRTDKALYAWDPAGAGPSPMATFPTGVADLVPAQGGGFYVTAGTGAELYHVCAAAAAAEPLLPSRGGLVNAVCSPR